MVETANRLQDAVAADPAQRRRGRTKKRIRGGSSKNGSKSGGLVPGVAAGPWDDVRGGLDVAFARFSFEVHAFGGNRGRDIPGIMERFAKRYRVGDQVGFDKHYLYKYLLHADGHTASWGLAKKLRTGSLIVFQESPRGFREFYYAHLKPYEHYVPLLHDNSNLADVRQWALQNDAAAGAIAAAATALVRRRLRPQARRKRHMPNAPETLNSAACHS